MKYSADMIVHWPVVVIKGYVLNYDLKKTPMRISKQRLTAVLILVTLIAVGQCGDGKAETGYSN